MPRYTRCKVCGSRKASSLFRAENIHGRHLVDTRDHFRVSKCQTCSAVFLPEVRTNKGYFRKYYQTGYYDQSDIRPGGYLDKFLSLLSNISIGRKERLILGAQPRQKSRLNVLDVGCGGGNFLSKLNPKKFNRYGTEINPEGYRLAVKSGLKVFLGELEKINFKRKQFEAVTLWHVLEHLDNPKKTLKTIFRLLSPGGLLVLQTPNTKSLGFRFGKKYWFHLDSPRHLVLYNPESVAQLCRLTGFKVVRVVNEFYDYPLDLFWSVRNSKLAFLVVPLYPLFKVASQEHLTYICQRV